MIIWVRVVLKKTVLILVTDIWQPEWTSSSKPSERCLSRGYAESGPLKLIGQFSHDGIWGICSKLVESWYTKLEQTPLNRCHLLPAPYKQLIQDIQETDTQTSNKTDLIWLTIHRPPTIYNRQIKTDLWLMTDLTQVFQPIPSKLNWTISFNRPDIRHRHLTNTIHLTLKMTTAQVVETSVTNNISFQNYPHPNSHTIWTNDFSIILLIQ